MLRESDIARKVFGKTSVYVRKYEELDTLNYQLFNTFSKRLLEVEPGVICDFSYKTGWLEYHNVILWNTKKSTDFFAFSHPLDGDTLIIPFSSKLEKSKHYILKIKARADSTHSLVLQLASVESKAVLDLSPVVIKKGLDIFERFFVADKPYTKLNIISPKMYKDLIYIYSIQIDSIEELNNNDMKANSVEANQMRSPEMNSDTANAPILLTLEKKMIQAEASVKNLRSRVALLESVISYKPNCPPTIEALKTETNFNNYICLLKLFYYKFVVVIAVSDTPCKRDMNAQEFFCLQSMGFATNLFNKYRLPYIAVLDAGTVIHEEVGAPREQLRFDFENNGTYFQVLSIGFASEIKHCAEINIGKKEAAEDFAINTRGLNIVVWDREKNSLVDSVAFDSFGKFAVSRNKAKL
jgi:hypothetical protein